MVIEGGDVSQIELSHKEGETVAEEKRNAFLKKVLPKVTCYGLQIRAGSLVRA